MKLTHRGLSVWISTDDEELDIWTFKKDGNIVARWDDSVHADFVGGHIAVENGQKLRVNVKSDGSMGAIAVDLCIDGYRISGPCLKGEGTAWIDGVSRSTSLPGGMAGSFCLEKEGDSAQDVDVTEKYRGAIALRVRFLGPYEGSQDDEDDDIEVLDNVQLPNTKRGCPSGLRVGLSGESDGQHKYPTYVLANGRCALPAVEFLFRYKTRDNLQLEGFRYMKEMAMERDHMKLFEAARVEALRQRQVEEAALRAASAKKASEGVVKKDKKKRSRGDESDTDAPNKRQSRAHAKDKDAKAKEASDVAAPGALAQSSGGMAASSSALPSSVRTLVSSSGETLVWDPPAYVRSDGARLSANTAPNMPANAPHIPFDVSIPTSTRNTDPSLRYAVQSSAIPWGAVASALDGYTQPSRPVAHVDAASHTANQNTVLYDTNVPHGSPGAIQSLYSAYPSQPHYREVGNFNPPDGVWMPQPTPNPSHHVQPYISGVVRHDTESLQLSTGGYALPHGQQSHGRPMYESQAPAPASYEHHQANTAARSNVAHIPGALHFNEARSAGFHPQLVQQRPSLAVPHYPHEAQYHDTAFTAPSIAGPSLAAPAVSQPTASGQTYAEPVQPSSTDAIDELMAACKSAPPPTAEETLSAIAYIFSQ